MGKFSERVGRRPANVAVLNNGRGKAARFRTLEAMCRVLGCQPGDLLEWVDETYEPGATHGAHVATGAPMSAHSADSRRR